MLRAGLFEGAGLTARNSLLTGNFAVYEPREATYSEVRIELETLRLIAQVGILGLQGRCVETGAGANPNGRFRPKVAGHDRPLPGNAM